MVSCTRRQVNLMTTLTVTDNIALARVMKILSDVARGVKSAMLVAIMKLLKRNDNDGKMSTVTDVACLHTN